MAVSDIMFAALGMILLGAGYLFTFGLIYVPFSRLRQLWIAEQGVDHLPLMYLLSLLNSLTWVAYGWLPPHKYSVLIICGVGIIAQIVYIIWYILICAHPVWRFITTALLVILLVSCGAVIGFMSFLDGGLFGGGPNSLDTPATITAALTYIGPFADTVVAFWTGDPARMSVQIIFVSLGNAFCWGEYGRITIANEYGLISPFVQLLVYLWLRRNELSEIFYEEIPQFYAQMTRLVSVYVLLRGDEEEDGNA